MARRAIYKVERWGAAERDLEAIFDFLVESYLRFGDHIERARTQGIKKDLRDLGKAPHQGTRHDNWLPGLRHVTKDRVIYYFTVDDEQQVVRVLAVFFGGQDHQRRMLRRLMSRD